MCFPSSVWQESRDQWLSTEAVRHLKVFKQSLCYFTNLRLIGPLHDIMNKFPISISVISLLMQFKTLFNGKKKVLISDWLNLTWAQLWPCDSWAQSRGSTYGRGTAWQNVVQRHPLVQKNAYHGPLKKSNKQSSWIQLNASQQNIRSALWIFFFIITGNETENSNILILLYCYRTTLSEVLQ